MDNMPVYDFLGYKVLEIKYARNTDAIVSSFTIKMDDTIKEHNICHIFVSIVLNFSNTDEVLFRFTAGFRINDLIWAESLSNEQLDMLFLSSVFPYFREKISSITDDSRGKIDLPIVDLKSFNRREKIVFMKKQ